MNATYQNNLAAVLNPSGQASSPYRGNRYSGAFMQRFAKQNPANWDAFLQAADKTVKGLRQYREQKKIRGTAAFSLTETTHMLPYIVEDTAPASELTRGIAAEILRQSISCYGNPFQVPGLAEKENDIIVKRVLEVAETLTGFFRVQGYIEEAQC